jgi:isoleucyl-tRNA synthetase
MADKRWQDTVNLPRTPFPMKGDLPRREPEILNLWQRIAPYRRAKERPGTPFFLHDGPPYANGSIHLGHVLNKVLKDAMVKFALLKGEPVSFVPGWDCHGLPIELKVEKELLKEGKKVSDEEFRGACRRYAEKYIEIQRQEFMRLGIFAEWDRPYRTMDFSYESATLMALADLVEKGYVYRSCKPVHFCVHCKTSLAEAEIEYEEKESPSIYVIFPLTEESQEKLKIHHPVSLMIWTTTPWTLPANQAIAIHPSERYRVVRHPEKGTFIVADRRVPELRSKFPEIEPVENLSFQAEDLFGIEVRPPFSSGTHKVVFADFVSMETGTGLVHIAPGHGLEDYEVGLRYHLEVLSPVDEEGRMLEPQEVKGLKTEEANPKLIALLRERGLLIFEERIRHNYPHCWRCQNPVIFRATDQWFLRIGHERLRQRLEEAVDRVRWIPEIGRNRIRGMIENRSDWCISRQRRWGVPITAFYCKGCGHAILDPAIMRGIARRFATEGSDLWFRVSAEELLPPGYRCPRCKGTDFEKEKDILDVWFDSGISFYATPATHPELKFPADLYLEGSDQHRGWFQSSLILSVALTGEPPYREVYTHGFVVDGEGRKMSKSLGNIISPEEVISQYGAEILRLWALSSEVFGDVRISPEILSHLVDQYRRIRNTFRFILGNLYDFDPTRHLHEFPLLLPLDRYYYFLLQEFLKDVFRFYEEKEFHRVVQRFHYFCAHELSSLYFDALKERLYTEHPESARRRSAQTVLYLMGKNLAVAIAPVLSFTAEEVWQNLPGPREESVFLASFRLPFRFSLSDEVLQEWEILRQLKSEVNRHLEEMRKRKEIGHSYEARVEIAAGGYEFGRLQKYEDLLPEWLIVSQVEIKEEKGEQGFHPTIIPNLRLKVVRAPGQRCGRCWRYLPEVGKNTRFPDLCLRCEGAVRVLFQTA